MKEKNKSTDLIKLAIKRMIPSGPLGRKQLSNCKIYHGIDHKHEAQNPIKLDIQNLNSKVEREKIADKIRKEIENANQKETILSTKDRELLSTFINKIFDELNLNNSQ